MTDRPVAAAGWLWIKEGFALFRKQPLQLSTLFLCYLLLMRLLSMIPVIGIGLPLLLVPVYSMAFMQACRDIEQDRHVTPMLLFRVFRTPALPRLLMLGVLYLAAAVLAPLASTVVDGGVFWKALTGGVQVTPELIRGSRMMSAMLFTSVLYVPAGMAFWYAAPLVDWQQMGVAKALFYSFFATLRAGRAFLVYGLTWAGLGILLPSIAGGFIASLTGRLENVQAIMLPMMLLVLVIMYCSFYPTYTTVFGKPDTSPGDPVTD
jgi:hypothetical protein